MMHIGFFNKYIIIKRKEILFLCTAHEIIK
jgi:hypothetical protein